MALVTRYETPAGLRDVPAGSSFYDAAWHEFVTARSPIPRVRRGSTRSSSTPTPSAPCRKSASRARRSPWTGATTARRASPTQRRRDGRLAAERMIMRRGIAYQKGGPARLDPERSTRWPGPPTQPTGPGRTRRRTGGRDRCGRRYGELRLVPAGPGSGSGGRCRHRGPW